MSMNKQTKWSIETIQEFLDISHKGYKLLSNTYRTVEEKIEISCPLGHIHYIKWKVFLNNQSKCQTCAQIKKQEERVQRTKERTEALGYEFIEMIDSNTARITCNNLHTYNVYLNNLKKGSRCRKCVIVEAGLKKRLSIDYVRDYIESVGYKLLSSKYESNETMLTVQCDKGHIYKVKYANFQSGRRCGRCSGSFHYTQKEVVEHLEGIGYKLLSVYESNNKDILIECDKKHRIEMKLTNILGGSRCRTCHLENNRGRQHPSWKGSQTVNLFLRAQTIDWKKESLELANYRCDITGDGGDMQIHHKYSFHMIVDDVLAELNLVRKESMDEYLNGEVISMIDLVKEKHSELLGVVLRTDIHKFYHSLFRYNNTEEQYDFFKQNYEALKNGSLSPQDFYVKAS